MLAGFSQGGAMAYVAGLTPSGTASPASSRSRPIFPRPSC
ncbi:MAG: hypothetical protein WDN30_03165 [Pararobbsia sp.]